MIPKAEGGQGAEDNSDSGPGAVCGSLLLSQCSVNLAAASAWDFPWI